MPLLPCPPIQKCGTSRDDCSPKISCKGFFHPLYNDIRICEMEIFTLKTHNYWKWIPSIAHTPKTIWKFCSWKHFFFKIINFLHYLQKLKQKHTKIKKTSCVCNTLCSSCGHPQSLGQDRRSTVMSSENIWPSKYTYQIMHTDLCRSKVKGGTRICRQSYYFFI